MSDWQFDPSALFDEDAAIAIGSRYTQRSSNLPLVIVGNTHRSLADSGEALGLARQNAGLYKDLKTVADAKDQLAGIDESAELDSQR